MSESKAGIKSSIFHIGRNQDIVEQMYDASMGEETEQISVLEGRIEGDAEGVKIALAEYMNWCHHGMDSIVDEYKRLKVRVEEFGAHAEWAAKLLRDKMGNTPGSQSIGNYTVQIRKGSQKVIVDNDCKIADVPDSMLRYTDPVDGQWDVDKAAVKKAVKAGELLPEGVTITTGDNTISIK